MDFVKKLDIQKVNQVKHVSGSISIYFEIDNIRYSLYLMIEKDGKYDTYDVFHETEKEYGYYECGFCKSRHNYGDCDALSDYKEELFKRLIQFPSIRLYWIYFPYKK